jgi:hypothetical protein
LCHLQLGDASAAVTDCTVLLAQPHMQDDGDTVNGGVGDDDDDDFDVDVASRVKAHFRRGLAHKTLAAAATASSFSSSSSVAASLTDFEAARTWSLRHRCAAKNKASKALLHELANARAAAGALPPVTMSTTPTTPTVAAAGSDESLTASPSPVSAASASLAVAPVEAPKHMLTPPKSFADFSRAVSFVDNARKRSVGDAGDAAALAMFDAYLRRTPQQRLARIFSKGSLSPAAIDTVFASVTAAHAAAAADGGGVGGAVVDAKDIDRWLATLTAASKSKRFALNVELAADSSVAAARAFLRSTSCGDDARALALLNDLDF